MVFFPVEELNMKSSNVILISLSALPPEMVAAAKRCHYVIVTIRHVTHGETFNQMPSAIPRHAVPRQAISDQRVERRIVSALVSSVNFFPLVGSRPAAISARAVNSFLFQNVTPCLAQTITFEIRITRTPKRPVSIDHASKVAMILRHAA